MSGFVQVDLEANVSQLSRELDGLEPPPQPHQAMLLANVVLELHDISEK